MNRFNRYIKGEDWDSKVSQYMAELKIRKFAIPHLQTL